MLLLRLLSSSLWQEIEDQDIVTRIRYLIVYKYNFKFSGSG